MDTSPQSSTDGRAATKTAAARRFVANLFAVSEPASSPAATWTPWGRIAAAATLILAPAFQLASFLFALENPTATEVARWAASEPSRANLSALFGLLAMPFLFGTALTYALLSRRHSPRFAWAGGILLGFAFVGLTAVGGLETALVSLSQDGRLDPATLGAAADAAATPPMIAIMVMFLPFALFGLLTMTVALWRSRAVPRAAVLLLPAFIVVDFFLQKGIAGHAIFLAAGIWFAWAVLATPIVATQPTVPAPRVATVPG